MAYALLCAMRRIGMAHTPFASATCGTIRLKLLKLGALVKISARRVRIAFASACPYAQEWRLASLTAPPRRDNARQNPRPTGETIPPIDENHRAPAPPTVTPAPTRPSNRAETDVQLPARVRNAG